MIGWSRFFSPQATLRRQNPGHYDTGPSRAFVVSLLLCFQQEVEPTMGTPVFLPSALSPLSRATLVPSDLSSFSVFLPRIHVTLTACHYFGGKLPNWRTPHFRDSSEMPYVQRHRNATQEPPCTQVDACAGCPVSGSGSSGVPSIQAALRTSSTPPVPQHPTLPSPPDLPPSTRIQTPPCHHHCHHSPNLGLDFFTPHTLKCF